MFWGPEQGHDEGLVVLTTTTATASGCVTRAAGAPSSADRLPAFTLTAEGQFLGTWDPTSAMFSSPVGDILEYDFAPVAKPHNGQYQITGSLITRRQGWGGFNGNLEFDASWPVCAGRPTVRPPGAPGSWTSSDLLVEGVPLIPYRTGCVPLTKNPSFSSPFTFTIRQAGTVIATWDVKTGQLMGPVGGAVAYDFNLAFTAGGLIHARGTITPAGPYDPDHPGHALDPTHYPNPQPFDVSWPHCP